MKLHPLSLMLSTYFGERHQHTTMCEKCKTVTNFERTAIIRELPDILVIHCVRFASSVEKVEERLTWQSKLRTPKSNAQNVICKTRKIMGHIAFDECK